MLLSALVIALTAPLLFGTPAALAAPIARSQVAVEMPVFVLQANIDGAQTGGSAAGLTDVLEEIENRKPDVILLQEVCDEQLDILGQRYSGNIVNYVVGRNDPPPPRSSCTRNGGGPESSYVIASKWPISNVTQDLLPGAREYAQYALFCADVAKQTANGPRTFRACSTKLEASNPDNPTYSQSVRAAQAVAIERLLSPIVSQKPVIMAGDFNAKPNASELRKIYRIGTAGNPADPNDNRGDFWEGDQNDPAHFGTVEEPEHDWDDRIFCPNSKGFCRTGEYTHGPNPGDYRRKFDYVFFSASSFARTRTALYQRIIPQGTPDGMAKHSMIFAKGTVLP